MLVTLTLVILQVLLAAKPVIEYYLPEQNRGPIGNGLHEVVAEATGLQLLIETNQAKHYFSWHDNVSFGHKLGYVCWQFSLMLLH